MTKIHKQKSKHPIIKIHNGDEWNVGLKNKKKITLDIVPTVYTNYINQLQFETMEQCYKH